ncbi:MAG: FecR family protein [Mangrovibacterium sp.]
MKENKKNIRLPFDDFSGSVKIKVKQPEILSGPEKRELWRRIETANKDNLKKKRWRYRALFSLCGGVAATLLVVLTINMNRKEKPAVQAVASVEIENVKAPDTQVTDIQLVINENKTVSSEENDVEITYDDKEITLTGKKEGLKKEELNAGETVAFNQLIVPPGKRSVLNLADGSKIWVNAGTRVVYPPVFTGEKREIYVDGEIFANVVHNEKCPFIVRTKNMEAEVLGTSFNVTAYESDGEQRIVLVSGSVKVNVEKGEAILVPNQMFSWDDRAFQVKNVNVNGYISWKEGIYQYDSESLDIILKRLSRYYGKEIACSPQAARLKCSGKLDMKDDLGRVLNGIAKTASVCCKFEDGKYRITDKKND